MRTFRIAATTLVAASVVAVAVASAAVYAGAYNVGADSPHWAATRWLLDTTRSRSVAAGAADIRPPELDGHDRLVRGAADFSAMCAGCHAPPGEQPGAMAGGVYPRPPDLGDAGAEMPPRQIYWTIAHGIKASGMPAWGTTHSADALWNMTALIQHFPDMTGDDYEQLLETAQARGLGHHDGGHAHGHDHDHNDAHGHADEHDH